MRLTDDQVNELVGRVDRLSRRLARRAGEPDLDEAASVGLVALAHAIRTYNRKRSSLSTYAELVVTCRVRDWVKTEQRYRNRIAHHAERLRLRLVETE